jgi:hypothetical protein
MAWCVAVFHARSNSQQPRKRAELKTRSLEEQQEAAERNKVYQARYCEKYATVATFALFLLTCSLGTGRICIYGKHCVVASECFSFSPSFSADVDTTFARVYKAKFGPEAYMAWRQAKRECRRRAHTKLRAKEAYHSGDEAEADADHPAPGHVKH